MEIFSSLTTKDAIAAVLMPLTQKRHGDVANSVDSSV